MKKKIFLTAVVIIGLVVFWFMGCTGEGVYDVEGPPETATPTVPPSVSPTATGSPQPTGTTGPVTETLTQLATGRANSFDLKLSGSYLYWVEKSSSPQGSVFRVKTDGTGSVETVISGLNNPSAMTFASLSGSTYLFVGEGEGSTGGVIHRVKVSDSAFPSETLTTGSSGELTYMSLLGGSLYFTRYAGGFDSAVMVTESFPDSIPVTPENVDTGISNAYDVKSVSLTSAVPVSFLLVTERLASPNGTVLLYNLTNSEGYPITPMEIATGQQMPTRVTFQPIYKTDNTTLVSPPQGYIYWTNYHSTSGQVMRQKIVFGSDGIEVKLDGSTEIVAQSLLSPYAILAPYDISSGATRATLNKLFVSKNRSSAENGNWYEIDISNSSSFPLSPSSTAVSNLIGESVQYPLNGIMSYGNANNITLAFTAYNDATGGDNNGIIYYWRRK